MRIVVGWDVNQLQVQIVHIHKQLIHCKVTKRSNREVVWFTIVYGMHTVTDKKELWNELIVHGNRMLDPWCIMGDINAVYDISHRFNGRLVSSYEMRDFSDCIIEVGLICLRSTCHWFSWHNKAHGVSRIASRIDHAFVNDIWLDREVNTMVHYCNHYLSDHSPIIC